MQRFANANLPDLRPFFLWGYRNRYSSVVANVQSSVVGKVGGRGGDPLEYNLKIFAYRESGKREGERKVCMYVYLYTYI